MSLSILLMVVGSCFVFFLCFKRFYRLSLFLFSFFNFFSFRSLSEGFFLLLFRFFSISFFFYIFRCLVLFDCFAFVTLMCSSRQVHTISQQTKRTTKTKSEKKIKDLITFSFNSTLKALSSFFNTPFCCCAPSLRGFFFSHQSMISFTKFFLIAL